MVSVVSSGSKNLSSRMSESSKPCINKPVCMHYMRGVGWGEWMVYLFLLSETYCMLLETIPNLYFLRAFPDIFIALCDELPNLRMMRLSGDTPVSYHLEGFLRPCCFPNFNVHERRERLLQSTFPLSTSTTTPPPVDSVGWLTPHRIEKIRCSFSNCAVFHHKFGRKTRIFRRNLPALVPKTELNFAM